MTEFYLCLRTLDFELKFVCIFLWYIMLSIMDLLQNCPCSEVVVGFNVLAFVVR